MEKWEIWLLLPQKPLNRSSPKFAWVILSVIPTPMQNFITMRLPPFGPLPNMQKCASSDSASYFGTSFRLHDPCTDFYNKYVKWRRFAQGCVFWGPENKILNFNPIFSPKRKFFANFRRDLENHVKKALTMGMLACKLPLIVIVALWKLYSK